MRGEGVKPSNLPVPVERLRGNSLKIAWGNPPPSGAMHKYAKKNLCGGERLLDSVKLQKESDRVTRPRLNALTSTTWTSLHRPKKLLRCSTVNTSDSLDNLEEALRES